MQQILRVDSICKSFSRTSAVTSVSFDVSGGEVVGIVGPNGAGKSTTLKLILGLLTPDSGSVTLFSDSPTLPTTRKRLGYMPENALFYPALTGSELLGMVGALYGMTKQLVAQRSKQVLAQVGLSSAAHQRMSHYSKGMLQRIYLAQSLLNQPELLLLDEPLDGLDPFGRSNMRDLLKQLKQAGTAIVFSSHILSDVEQVCDRLILMDSGHIVKQGNTKQLLHGKSLEDFFMTHLSSRA
jgi:ABC-2 type transport system ATP-binding protein